jgi:hypothetical protein
VTYENGPFLRAEY